jgi:hypothetical protein
MTLARGNPVPFWDRLRGSSGSSGVLAGKIAPDPQVHGARATVAGAGSSGSSGEWVLRPRAILRMSMPEIWWRETDRMGNI